MKIKQDKKLVKRAVCLDSIFEPRGVNNYVVVSEKLSGKGNLHSILQPTRMKRSLKDGKQTDKNLSIKSLKATLKNIFRTNVRL